MTAVRRYEGSMYDSNRWDGFELRPGDIIISTPPKCGTTWTQMIRALLILQEPELPLPLDTLSPRIDMVTRARTDVFADLEAQTHRRFIKTGAAESAEAVRERHAQLSKSLFGNLIEPP
jgi:hypothetical protein